MTRHNPQTVRAKSCCDIEGNWCASIFEASVSNLLIYMQKAGELVSIMRQKTIRLPCGVSWRIDFLVTNSEGQEYFVEAKGLVTDAYIQKLKMYKQCPEYQSLPLFVIKKRGRDGFIVSDVVNAGGIMPPI